jgi:membrane dipeptidase
MENDLELFDGHCDTISRCQEDGGHLRERPGHLDLRRTGSFGRYAQFFALYADDALLRRGMTFSQIYTDQYALFRSEMERSGDLAAFCTTGKQAEEANRAGKAAAFLSVEGAELLGCSLHGLEDAFTKGVRAVNLTWNRANPLSGSNCQESERGLGEAGKAFVLRMQELGMLADLSHLSDPGIRDVLETARKPVIASHSNSRAVCPHRRNLTDEQFTAIIENGGVVGLCMFADFLGDDAGLDTVTAHLEHFLELGGQNNISIGGDWDGCARLPRGMDGIQDMEKLREHLLRRNYSEELIRAVFYQNLMRVVNEVCTM